MDNTLVREGSHLPRVFSDQPRERHWHMQKRHLSSLEALKHEFVENAYAKMPHKRYIRARHAFRRQTTHRPGRRKTENRYKKNR